MSAERKLSISQDAELAVGATGAVLAIDQIMKGIDSEDNQESHLVRAAIGAAVALGAYQLLKDGESNGRARRLSLSSSTSGTRSRSTSPHEQKHHDRHLFEEILGAYSLGKEILGDKRHHITHLVGETIGATGAWQEWKEQQKEKGRH